MTDKPDDPWKSLADELGLEPGEVPRPTPTTSSAPPPAAFVSTPSEHAAPPPKKPAADWSALAGSLGLEPTSDFALPPRDPVAELFGLPASMPLPPEERESARAERDMIDDELGDYRERYVSDDRVEPEFRSEASTRPPEDRSDRPRPRRRRGGRGRGRERPDDRSGYDQDRRPSSIERRDDDRPRMEGAVDRDLEPELRADEPDDELLNDRRDRETSAEERPSKRRRRGRRGRGRSRDREEIHRKPPTASTGEGPAQSSDASLMDEPMEIEFIPLDEDGSELERDPRAERYGSDAASSSDNGSDDMNEFQDEPHGGKSSVRDIVTWKEAIGMIIEANIQNHARSPQGGHSSSHHGSHGPRDSRGRGPGRGRGRGGSRR